MAFRIESDTDIDYVCVRRFHLFSTSSQHLQEERKNHEEDRAHIYARCLFVSTALWAQQNPQLGTWKQNLAKSQYVPGPPPKSPTVLTREAAGANGMKTITNGIDAKGNKTHSEVSTQYDGKDYPLAGSPDYDSTSSTKLDLYTDLDVNKKDGKVVRVVYRTAAKDGKSYTAYQFGAYANNVPFRNIVVYEKQ